MYSKNSLKVVGTHVFRNKKTGWSTISILVHEVEGLLEGEAFLMSQSEYRPDLLHRVSSFVRGPTTLWTRLGCALSGDEGRELLPNHAAAP
jgi:hypothetical protein